MSMVVFAKGATGSTAMNMAATTAAPLVKYSGLAHIVPETILPPTARKNTCLWHLSQRAQQVTPFLAMEVMEQAKSLEAAGRDIIYLCLGEPDFATPEKIVAAAQQAIAEGHTAYTHSLGLLELREEICRHYRRRYQVTIDPDQVIVSSGTSPLMLLLFAALLDTGDELILTNPGYACYANFIRFNGGVPVEIVTRAEQGFQPAPEDVRKRLSPRSRGLLINSPSNPAGSLLSADWLEQLASLPVPIISDEIYHGLTYQGEGAQYSRVHQRSIRPRWLFQNLRHDRLASWLPHRP